MQERGATIIKMAEELLRTGTLTPSSAAPAPPPRISAAVVVLILAVFLTAVASSAMTKWVLDGRRSIDRYERAELDALIFYIARTKGLDEKDLRQDIQTRLDIQELTDIKDRDFSVVRRYLQEKAQ